MESSSPFGFENADDSPGFLLWQTTMIWQRQIRKAIEPHDVSHTQFVIMAILLFNRSKNKLLTQNDIVETSKLDKMTVSIALKKLVRQHLVCREENKYDSRAKSVYLTQRGISLAEKLVPIVEGVDATFFEQLSKKGEQEMIRLLRQLVKED